MTNIMIDNDEKVNDNKDNEDNKDKKVFAAIAAYSQLGFSMSACVAIGIIGGIFLDRRLGTSPLFLILGCLIGTGASFKALYDLAVKKQKNKTKKVDKDNKVDK